MKYLDTITILPLGAVFLSAANVVSAQSELNNANAETIGQSGSSIPVIGVAILFGFLASALYLTARETMREERERRRKSD